MWKNVLSRPVRVHNERLTFHLGWKPTETSLEIISLFSKQSVTLFDELRVVKKCNASNKSNHSFKWHLTPSRMEEKEGRRELNGSSILCLEIDALFKCNWFQEIERLLKKFEKGRNSQPIIDRTTTKRDPKRTTIITQKIGHTYKFQK